MLRKTLTIKMKTKKEENMKIEIVETNDINARVKIKWKKASDSEVQN